MFRCFVKLFKRKYAPLHSTFIPIIDSNNALEFWGMLIALSTVLHTGTHEMRRTDINLHLKDKEIETQNSNFSKVRMNCW